MQHNWTIVKLLTATLNNHNNVVTGIEWQLTTKDENDEVSVGKIQPINYVDGNFVEYNNLTEQQVKDWLFHSMGERKEMFEQQLESNINKARNKIANQLPWL